MIVGGLLGFEGAALPVIEPTILASVVVLGAAIAFALRPPLPLACAVDRALRRWPTATPTGSRAPTLGGLRLCGRLRRRDRRAARARPRASASPPARLGRPAIARALGGAHLPSPALALVAG